MQRYDRICTMWTHVLRSMKDLSVDSGGRSLTSTSLKAAFSRRPIRVHQHQPQQLQMNLKNPVEVEDSGEGRKQNSSHSSGIFNLTMGEVMMSKSRKRIAVEGVRLVEEALKARLKLEKLFILKTIKDLSPGLNDFLELEKRQKTSGKSDLEVHRVSSKLMQTWSSVATPPGIIGIFQKPNPGDVISRSEKPEDNVPLTVICDNIREPGNLGSILRSAAGVGCKEVFLTKGCVDSWNMKVLRGACGAHFYIPILSDISTDVIQSSIRTTLHSDEEKQQAVKSKVALLVADSNFEDPRLEIPLLSHNDVDYASFQHVFLVIGGETEGIGSEIVELVKGFCNNDVRVVPVRIRISLANNMDSLNAANAFGIIAFEMNRQLRGVR